MAAPAPRTVQLHLPAMVNWVRLMFEHDVLHDFNPLTEEGRKRGRLGHESRGAMSGGGARIADSGTVTELLVGAKTMIELMKTRDDRKAAVREQMQEPGPAGAEDPAKTAARTAARELAIWNTAWLGEKSPAVEGVPEGPTIQDFQAATLGMLLREIRFPAPTSPGSLANWAITSAGSGGGGLWCWYTRGAPVTVCSISRRTVCRPE
jgi:hypothetical protein